MSPSRPDDDGLFESDGSGPPEDDTGQPWEWIADEVVDADDFLSRLVADETVQDPDGRGVLDREVDDALVDRVAERFIASVDVRGRRVFVMVQNGVVILEGIVDSEESKHAAGRLAWQTPGVVDVCNMLVPIRHGELGER